MTTAIDTSCQACGAEPGTVCVTNKGQQREPHRTRIKATEKLKAYLAYWDNAPRRAHHEVDCCNPDCNAQLKIAKPDIGTGDMWNSLAQCPYCHGYFFYESRPRRIDMAYKGSL